VPHPSRVVSAVDITRDFASGLRFVHRLNFAKGGIPPVVSRLRWLAEPGKAGPSTSP